MSASRNLVVLRCGDASLHRTWLSPNRRWDLAISYFGKDEERSFPEAAYVHRFKGGKWDGLYSFFAAHPTLIDAYDYFWLPDDDIEADGDGIDRLFRLMATNDMELAQPSLSAPSYMSHLVCAWNPLFAFRNVNLIEIMVPVLKASLLRKVLPLFEGSKSGFGIDFVWHRFTSDPLNKVAVIDAVQVTHTRPVGSVLQPMMANQLVATAGQEQDRLLSDYGNVTKTELILGGRLRYGGTIRSRRLAASIAALGWLCSPIGRHGFRHALTPLKFQAWTLKNWFYSLKERSNEHAICIDPIIKPRPSAIPLQANQL